MQERPSPLVLIVDDYQDAREMYAEFLEAEGFRVAKAADGYEALQKAGALSPDLILMDVALPGIDGWETTRRLRSQTSTANIPVIALTGLSGSEVAEVAREAGCTLLLKPALPDQVASAIRTVLGR